MGPHMLYACLAAALSSLCAAAPVSESFVVLISSPISVHRGQTVTLPCWLNPPQNAESLEVRWYRGDDHYDSPVMLYQDKTLKNTSQEASYKGRVMFGSKDAGSQGLMTGDVSLKLLNTTLQDAGHFTCYVSSDQVYDRASVQLIVTETGTQPLLSPVWREDNMVNMSCESEGWYPQPNLSWFSQKEVLSPKDLKVSNDSSGLFSVHSWILVSRTSEVSCSVGPPGEEGMKARVRLMNAPQAASGSSAAGWVLFALLLIAVLAALGFLFFKRRGKKTEVSQVDGDNEERKGLLPKGEIKEAVQPTDLSTANEHYVNIALDKTDSPYLKVLGSKLRDGSGPFPDGEKVTCLTAIKGKPGFSSGKHYWEAYLGNVENPSLPFKQSWWVGVTSAAVIPKNQDFSPNTSNHFWFMSSSRDRADHFQFSTEPRVLVPVSSRPLVVGVYLDYDSGELSFYNVDQNCLICSFTATFTGEVFPLFNPGKGDKLAMEILQRENPGKGDQASVEILQHEIDQGQEQGSSSDTGKSVAQPAQETKA